jgi:hypothetical protein
MENRYINLNWRETAEKHLKKESSRLWALIGFLRQRASSTGSKTIKKRISLSEGYINHHVFI